MIWLKKTEKCIMNLQLGWRCWSSNIDQTRDFFKYIFDHTVVYFIGCINLWSRILIEYSILEFKCVVGSFYVGLGY